MPRRIGWRLPDSRRLLVAAAAVLGAMLAAMAIGAACMVSSMEGGVAPAASPDAAQMPVTDSDDVLGILPAQPGESGFKAVDWDYWDTVNPDVVGWVSIPGTSIDYPIVQARPEAPSFYLEHDVNKQYNPMGCPYLDASCLESGLESENAVVSGHHWSNGRMFADFAKYASADFAEANRDVYVQTREWRHVYKVAAVEVIQGSKKIKQTEFATFDEFKGWLQERFREASVQLAPDPIGADCPSRIITFCTCSYNIWKEDERTLVYASY